MSDASTKPGAGPKSAYFLSHSDESVERRTLAVLVDNEPGVLARVVGLFSGRGYNIDSLTVAEVDASQHRSRITIVTQGTPHILEQIEAQLLRIVPVTRRFDTVWAVSFGMVARRVQRGPRDSGTERASRRSFAPSAVTS